ncbi:MAG TPA: TniQ family protein [Pseudaminobacter sp.]|nr:TniQ family protein [Pseudaminobacter sp.]
MCIEPQLDELQSSWLHRLAFANGVAPRSFAGLLGLGQGMRSARLDLRLPRDVATLLGRQTGVSQETISAVAHASQAITAASTAGMFFTSSTTASQSASRWSSSQSRARISGPRLSGKASRAFAPCPAVSTSWPSATRGAKFSPASSRLERANTASISASSSARASSWSVSSARLSLAASSAPVPAVATIHCRRTAAMALEGGKWSFPSTPSKGKLRQVNRHWDLAHLISSTSGSR